jgi:hypothetical protein
VLFIDLLGVREMNRGRSAGRHLAAIERAVVRGAYRDFLTPDSLWLSAFFSDTLVLASPASRAGDEESAIDDLVTQAAWLQLNLIAEGFFVRGALTLGKFHLREGLIFGPALIEAHDLERDVAIHPRIILGADAERSQREDLQAYDSPDDSPQNVLLLRDDEGSAFINYLGPLFEEPTDPTPALAMHRDVVTARLHEHRGQRSFWEKYRWVAEYHNAVIATRLPRETQLLIDTANMTSQFQTFV